MWRADAFRAQETVACTIGSINSIAKILFFYDMVKEKKKKTLF